MPVGTTRSARSRLAWLLLLPLAVAAGALVSINMSAALALGGLAATLALLSLGRRATSLFMAGMAAAMLGYAFMGRGFAYIGVPPIHVGELMLILGCFAVITSIPTRRPGIIHLVLIAFMAWGAWRTVPYLGTYGVDALRDAAVWGYAVFALALSLLLTPRHIRRFVRLYRGLLPVFVLWVPILAIVWVAFEHLVPVPWTGVAIPYFKSGDMAVHLAGAAAFVLVGLYPRRGWRGLSEPIVWTSWLAGVVVAASISRGAMLAIGSVAVVIFFRRALSRWATVVLIGLFLLAVFGSTNLEIRTGGHRNVSAEQLIENVQSLFGDTEIDDQSLVGTRQWREAWWNTIIGYTIRGPHFWQGKGYGIHLAADDGFLVSDGSNRAPHNAHLNILARSGVPGLALWLALQASFAIILLRAAYTAGRLRRPLWLAITGWVFAYWLAALANMSFDVYLEGPQGGVVFWSLMGFGLGAAACVEELARTHRASRPEAPHNEAAITPAWGRRAPAARVGVAIIGLSLAGGSAMGMLTSGGLAYGEQDVARAAPSGAGQLSPVSEGVEGPAPAAPPSAQQRSAPNEPRSQLTVPPRVPPHRSPELVGVEIVVSPGSYSIYRVEGGSAVESSQATFAGRSRAPAEMGVLANGLLYWQITQGGLAGWSYIAPGSGTFSVRELYRLPDGELQTEEHESSGE